MPWGLECDWFSPGMGSSRLCAGRGMFQEEACELEKEALEQKGGHEAHSSRDKRAGDQQAVWFLLGRN